jgi:hypothetical protein
MENFNYFKAKALQKKDLKNTCFAFISSADINQLTSK